MSETVTQAGQGAIPTGAAVRPAARTPRVLRDVLCLDDFEAPARRLLPRPIYGFISGGVENNVSRDGNRAAFDELAFLPPVSGG